MKISDYKDIHIDRSDKSKESFKVSFIVKDNNNVIINAIIKLKSKNAYTVIIAGLVNESKIALLYKDDLNCPKEGKAKLRFINGAAGAPTVDVLINKKEIWSKVAYKNTGSPTYVELKPGFSEISVQKDSKDLFEPLGAFLSSGGIYTMITTGDISTVMCIDRASSTCDTLQKPFDVSKYVGKWYEIAKLPQPFESGCARATAEYKILDATTLSVYNVCYDKDWKEIRNITGKAKILDANVPAEIQVQFPNIPNIPADIPNYLVHSTNYEYAVIGSPDRSNLFILYRESKMCNKLYDKLVKFAKSLGYDTSKLVINYHAIN